MRKETLYIGVIFLFVALLILRNFTPLKDKGTSYANKSALSLVVKKQKSLDHDYKQYCEIKGNVKKGETFFDIFIKHKLDILELFKIKKACANIYKLSDIRPGQPYKIIVDKSSQINKFIYWIDNESILNIIRTENGFCASKRDIEYKKRILYIGGTIKDNLIMSIGEGKNNTLLALHLSDIFAWDIDFNTDLRNGDVFKIIVESCYLNNNFKKYGDIIAAEFINNGVTYHAYRYENNGDVDYYDDNGRSLRRAFLKAPLSFRRISSRFSKNRFHPILKIYRPHLGVDYAAPTGTPVSSVGDGTVIYSGYKGQSGKLVVIRHPNGYRTYYGHLSRIKKGIKRGVKVKQGQVIGFVGATGLATGPHLDYRIKKYNKFVNPLTLNLPRGKSIPKTLMADFNNFKNKMDKQLTSISPPAFKFAELNKENNI